jgi:hypothetical protein
MTTCAEIKQSIGAWLDRELSGARADAVRLHLESCTACAEEQRQLAKLDVTIRAVLESEATLLDTRSFWHDLRQRIEVKRPWHGKLADWTGATFRAPSFAWMVPGVILLLIGGLYFDLFSPDWVPRPAPRHFTSVESIDAYGRNVALLREYETKTTVIWLYQNPDGEDEASGDVVDKGPAF